MLILIFILKTQYIVFDDSNKISNFLFFWLNFLFFQRGNFHHIFNCPHFNICDMKDILNIEGFLLL
jgi:hypothetical protein